MALKGIDEYCKHPILYYNDYLEYFCPKCQSLIRYKFQITDDLDEGNFKETEKKWLAVKKKFAEHFKEENDE